MVLVMLAHHFLVWMRVQWHERAPALTLAQVRLVLISVLTQPVLDAQRALMVVADYQRRNLVTRNLNSQTTAHPNEHGASEGCRSGGRG